MSEDKYYVGFDIKKKIASKGKKKEDDQIKSLKKKVNKAINEEEPYFFVDYEKYNEAIVQTFCSRNKLHYLERKSHFVVFIDDIQFKLMKTSYEKTILNYDDIYDTYINDREFKKALYNE
jgi:hypothetical protein